MGSAQPPLFRPVLSLPPAVDPGMFDHVGAPFALAPVQAMQTEQHGRSLATIFTAGIDLGRLAGAGLLACDPDPLALLELTMATTGPQPDIVAAAFNRLLDAPFRGKPWGQWMQSVYLSSCPACGSPTMAQAYRWRGAPPALASRVLACENCGFAGESAPEPSDLDLATNTSPGRLLQSEMLGRALAAEHPQRSRLEQVMGFYTPRNLWVLWESLRILGDMSLPVAERRAVQSVLMHALWLGSSLADQPDLLWQTHLRRPRHFQERNLWLVLHEALAKVQRISGRWRKLQVHQPESLGPDAVFLAQRWPAQLRRQALVHKVGLALLSVPPALPLVWLLRHAWSGWLFGPEAAAIMTNLPALRPGGSKELGIMIHGASSAALSWLAPGGRLLVQWRWRGNDDPSPDILAALPPLSIDLSVAEARPHEWTALAVIEPGRKLHGPTANDPAILGPDILTKALTERGEPMPLDRLRPLLLGGWQQAGLLPRGETRNELLGQALDPAHPAAGMQTLGTEGGPWEGGAPWWWLEQPPSSSDPASPWQPASDQAERRLVALVQSGAFAHADALTWELTARLAPACAPDRPWIDQLLDSYCQPDSLTLRAADDPARRAAEIAALAIELAAMGERFGFVPAEWQEEDITVVEWQRRGERVASFVLSATTALTPRLWASRIPLPGLRRFLVLPASRSGLVHWRISHQPLWAAAAAAGGWVFVKWSHLRSMLAAQPDVPLDHWLNQLDLDPMTAVQPKQMRLF